MSTHHNGRIDPTLGLKVVAADQITPLFRVAAVDIHHARQMAISAIDAYQPHTRADCVNAVRTIAFSMAALSLLGQAASHDMTMPEKLRVFGRANALNRSADQSERTMMQRQRQQRADHAQPPAPEPNDAEAEAAIAEAMNAYRASVASPEPEAAPDPAPKSTATQPAAMPHVPDPDDEDRRLLENSEAKLSALRGLMHPSADEGDPWPVKNLEAFLAARAAELETAGSTAHTG